MSPRARHLHDGADWSRVWHCVLLPVSARYGVANKSVDDDQEDVKKRRRFVSSRVARWFWWQKSHKSINDWIRSWHVWWGWARRRYVYEQLAFVTVINCSLKSTSTLPLLLITSLSPTIASDKKKNGQWWRSTGGYWHAVSNESTWGLCR